MAEPSALQIDVEFADHDLWRPRYPSLINSVFYDPGFLPLQIEPAFQVCSGDPLQEVKVFFEIPESENVVFKAAESGGLVTWQSLVPSTQPGPAPFVEVTLCDGDLRRCCVEWRRSGEIPATAHVTALRIVCEHVLGGPPRDSDDWALTRVEGGAYLVIIDRGKEHPFPEPAEQSAEPVQGRVQILGFDASSRPVYDLFRKDFSLPEGLALELAFRAGHGEQIEFDLALKLPDDPYGDVRFKTDASGEVEMSYAVPDWKPEELSGCRAGEDGRLCRMQWKRAPLDFCPLDPFSEVCSQGRTADLSMKLDPGRLRGTPLGDALSMVQVDPTVIDPPACDASGVCTKPRDRGCS